MWKDGRGNYCVSLSVCQSMFLSVSGCQSVSLVEDVLRKAQAQGLKIQLHSVLRSDMNMVIQFASSVSYLVGTHSLFAQIFPISRRWASTACFTLCKMLVGCSTSHTASITQGWICLDNCACCYTEIETADQTSCSSQSQCTEIRPASPSAYPIMPGERLTPQCLN